MEPVQIPRKRHGEKLGIYSQKILDLLKIDEVTPKQLGDLIGKSPQKAGMLLTNEMKGWSRYPGKYSVYKRNISKWEVA